MMWDSETKTLDDACKAAKHLLSLGFRVRFAILPKDKDPNECEPYEVVAAFRGAERCTASSLIKLRLKLMQAK